eukprot:CAMPEP_0170300322 /NCGR_PEP_ID=MMETSP0116_2-20130129/50391_1 /TAXON_ID=400756 /ORGANISM="Durinskia baltica, Strain CSIRO CS-38" /LENGTH=168 /DNA_ID=CAMNT_0010552085 /DNA_START=21 /DNA_END=524 /DNA_ORIENTATION=+
MELSVVEHLLGGDLLRHMDIGWEEPPEPESPEHSLPDDVLRHIERAEERGRERRGTGDQMSLMPSPPSSPLRTPGPGPQAPPPAYRAQLAWATQRPALAPPKKRRTRRKRARGQFGGGGGRGERSRADRNDKGAVIDAFSGLKVADTAGVTAGVGQVAKAAAGGDAAQ